MAAQVGIIYSKAVVDINEALKRLDTLEGRMKGLEGRTIRIDSKTAVRGLESLAKAFKAPTDAYNNLVEGLGRMGDKLTSLGMNLASFGYRMMLATSPLAAAGFASLKMATDLDTSMAMVGTQLELRGAELEEFIDRVTKGTVDLSTKVPLATNDLADALYYLVSSMTIDPEVAAQFIEPIAKIAVAGHSAAEEVAKAITPILNVYKGLGMTAEGIEHVGDVILSAVKKGRGEFSDFAVQVGDFIQFAEQAGATFEEAMAAFAMATRVTTPAQAATWIANLYRAFITPTGIKALQEMGIQTSEVVEATGQWATRTVELTDAQAEQAVVLETKLATAQERVKEATLDVNIAVGKAQSTWDDYTGSVITSLETGSLIEGVSKTGINAYQRLQKAQEDVIKIQGELAGTTAHVGETYQAWTGEQVLRPSIELMTEIAEAVGAMKSEEDKLIALQPIFPRIRSMQGALLFIANLEEIIEWEEEFVESTGLTQEMFEIMMGTFESKIGVLKNMFLALGFDLINEYADDLKRLIDGLTDLFAAFRELPEDTKSKVAMISGLLLLAGPAALVGSVLMMGGGMLISLIAAFASLPSLVTLTALGVLFGDKVPIFLGALGAYGGGVEGFAKSIADLAVHFGILSKEDAIGILDSLGIEINEFDDQKIADIATGIENIATAVSAGVEDFKEWVQAFGDFLRDVQEREGAVGTLVEYLERLWAIVKDVAGFVAPKLGLPEEPYEEWGREEKAGIIDRAMAFLIGSKLASWIFAGLAGGLKTLITVGALLKIFGVVGVGAGATATGGGVIAATGSAIGVALSGAIEIALIAGLAVAVFAALDHLVSELDAYWARRGLPGRPFAPPPSLEEEIGTSGLQAELDKMPGTWTPPTLAEAYPWLDTLRRAFTEHLIPPLQEEWRKFWDWVTDYPGEVGPVLFPAAPWWEELFMRAPGDLEREFRAWGPLIEDGIVAPFQDADADIQRILNKWGGRFDDIARDREPRIKPIFHDEEKLNRWIKDFRWLAGRHESIWHVTEYIQRRYEGKDVHLGGYPMHEGGYPSLNLPNLLASEYVLSPRTTQVLENYLGRLDQQKVRSAVTHAPVGMTINFFKGSVASKDDAEQAADVIFDRIADRARGLSLMET